MHYLAKVGIATLGVGAVAGGSTAGYLHMTRKSFADELGISVLELTGNKDQTVWEKRKGELNSASASDLDSTLNSLKNTTWQKLQKWCNDNSTNSYDKESKKFKNFESFCTWKIGDKKWDKKINSDVPATDNKWGQAHSALSGINNLPKALKTVKDTAAGNNNADKTAMRNWCIETYKETWKGDQKDNFVNASKYCKST